MGILLWMMTAFLSLILARIIPAGRARRWAGELATATAAALLFGVIATALDFGGWNELDWRAGLFTFLGAWTAIGAFRAVALARVRSRPPV